MFGNCKTMVLCCEQAYQEGTWGREANHPEGKVISTQFSVHNKHKYCTIAHIIPRGRLEETSQL